MNYFYYILFCFRKAQIATKCPVLFQQSKDWHDMCCLITTQGNGFNKTRELLNEHIM